MNHKLTLSISVLHPLLQTAESYGINKNQLLADCEISNSILESPDNRFTLAEYDRLISKIVELTGDDYFGLRLGKNFSFGTASIVAYIMLNCSTLLEAGEKYITYQQIVDETTQVELTPVGNQVGVTIRLLSETTINHRHMLDAIVVNAINIFQEMVISAIEIDRIDFVHNHSEYHTEYQKHFTCELAWGQPVTAIWLKSEFLKAPLRQPNPELVKVLEEQAAQILVKIKGEESFTQKVWSIINRPGFDYQSGLEKIAAQLPTTSRTLQNKLKAENTSFQKLLNASRKEKALIFIKNGISITEATYLLGFSEPSVFQKAFKKWTGATPGEYRKQSKSN